MCSGAKDVISSGSFQGQDSYPMLRQSKSIKGEDDYGIRVNETGKYQSFGLYVTYEDEV